MISEISERKRKKILNSLTAAIHREKDKQDDLVKRLDELKNTPPNAHIKRLQTLGWSGLCEAMGNEQYPPKKENRKVCSDTLSHDPRQIKLDNIKDEVIRGTTQLLISVTEQKQRLSAMVTFFKITEGNPDQGEIVWYMFKLWTEYYICTQLSKEQLEAGNEKKAESLLQVTDAWAGAFKIFSKDPESVYKSITR